MSNQFNDASASVNITNNRRRNKTKSTCLCLISSMMQALVLILRTTEEGTKQRAVVYVQSVQ